MPNRECKFRIAIRKFDPFESAIRKQWELFRRAEKPDLILETEALDLHPLHASLFERNGLRNGEWDVAFISTDWLAEAAATSALVDISPYLAADPPEGYPAAWTDSLLRFQRFDARVLGLPYHDGPECLVYRKDLFENPQEQRTFQSIFGEPLRPPETWDGFRQVARYFTRPKQNLYGTVFAAFPDGHNTVYDFCLQLWTRGGELFEPDGRMRLETPPAAEALEFYRAIINDRAAVHPKCRELDSVKAGLVFAAGEVAMMVNWFGFAAMSETIAGSNVKGQVAVAPVPRSGGPAASLNAYWILGIGSGSPHRETAWRFLRHCAGPAMDKLLTLEGGIGCRKSTWCDAEVNAVIPFYHGLERLHEGARELPRLTHWAALAAVIDEMVLSVINTGESVRTVAARAQSRLDQLRETA